MNYFSFSYMNIRRGYDNIPDKLHLITTMLQKVVTAYLFVDSHFLKIWKYYLWLHVCLTLPSLHHNTVATLGITIYVEIKANKDTIFNRNHIVFKQL